MKHHGVFHDMPFTIGDTPFVFVHGGKEAVKILRKNLAVSMGHDLGSITVWWGNDRQWHGTLHQWQSEKIHDTFPTKTGIATWFNGVIQQIEKEAA